MEKHMKNINAVEQYFSQNTFFANNRISIADFYMVYVLCCATSLICKADQAKYVNIVRYINTILGQYPSLATIAKTNFCEQPF